MSKQRLIIAECSPDDCKGISVRCDRFGNFSPRDNWLSAIRQGVPQSVGSITQFGILAQLKRVCGPLVQDKTLANPITSAESKHECRSIRN